MRCKKEYADPEKYRKYKREYQKRYRKKANAGKYPRRGYTIKEDEMILEQVVPDRELAEKLQRSITAIQLRRHNLKKKGD